MVSARAPRPAATRTGSTGFFRRCRPASLVLNEGWDITDYRTGRTSAIPRQRGYRHTYGAFHPSRPIYATGTGSTVSLWDIRTGRQLGQTLSTPDGSWVTELDWTPEARRLAVSTISGRVSLHDGTTLEQVGETVDVGEPLSWVVARPDDHSAVVLTGSVEPTGSWTPPGEGWALVDFRDGRVVRRGELGMRFPFWLALSPDGRTAAVAGGDDADATGNAGATGAIQLIDLTSGEPLGPPREWDGGIRVQVEFSPDGSQLLATSGGGLAALWDVSTASPVARIQVPGTPVLSGAFEPDGQAVRLFDWSTGQVVVWELDFDKAVDFACRVAGRDFTTDEWREHFRR